MAESPEHFKIAIVGSGPAGLAAAARAAERGASHVLLERTDHLSDTIYKYFKGKHVMATPELPYPLRSDVAFTSGPREEVLGRFDEAAAKCNVRLKSEVTRLRKEDGHFVLEIAGQAPITADAVVLAIGMQGNIRKLGLPGSERDWIGYQLDDPRDYAEERIVVIGGGDAGIENALSLCGHNRVTLLHNLEEFIHAKPANVSLLKGKIKDGAITVITRAKTTAVEDWGLMVETPDGDNHLRCDRVIARIGAQPPRKFLEDCGIKFDSPNPNAVPSVGDDYQTEVPGLYLVGALTGYPLIKHCLNQGHDVVEFILNQPVVPVDEDLLKDKLKAAKVDMSVQELVQLARAEGSLLASQTTMQVREVLLSSEIHPKRAGETVFKINERAQSVFAILKGSVKVEAPDAPTVTLPTGAFFGEICVVMGRRRTATVTAVEPSLLIEIPRNAVIRLMRRDPVIHRAIYQASVARLIYGMVTPAAPREAAADVIATAEMVNFRPGEILLREGAADDGMYLIASGSVVVTKTIGGQEQTINYVPAGRYVGEVALIRRTVRNATVKAAVATEAIRINGEKCRALLEQYPALRDSIIRVFPTPPEEIRPETGKLIDYFLLNGGAEAQDILLIDESLCVRCDNCEKACADTHDGVSRLDREAGPTFAMLHVPTSCRHCEHPHCMADCPPDALNRLSSGEVVIDHEKCIGCGNCQRNCPYGVIQMAEVEHRKPRNRLLSLLFGTGNGHPAAHGPDHHPHKLAVKCDLCSGRPHGPACVNACPTGAALRVEPERFVNLIHTMQG